METRILIIQESIPHYRIAFFNMIALQADLTVMHAGRRTEGVLFSEYQIELKRFKGFLYVPGLIRMIRDGRYNCCVIAFDLHWLQLPFLVYRQRSENRLLLWGHRYSSIKLINKIRLSLLKRSSGCILYNAEEQLRLEKDGVPRDKIYIAENTINIVNSKNFSSNSKSSFLYVGRAQSRKRVDLLLIEFKRVKSRLPSGTKVRIVGEGEENIRLVKLCERLDLVDHVDFLGKITDDNELAELFSEAYAYVSPEAIGLGAQHSFAYGVPVITSKNGYVGAEYSNLSHGVNCFLYENQSDLGEYLVKVSTDLKLMTELGNNAFDLYGEKLSIKRMVEGFMKSTLE